MLDSWEDELPQRFDELLKKNECLEGKMNIKVKNISKTCYEDFECQLFLNHICEMNLKYFNSIYTNLKMHNLVKEEVHFYKPRDVAC